MIVEVPKCVVRFLGAKAAREIEPNLYLTPSDNVIEQHRKEVDAELRRKWPAEDSDLSDLAEVRDMLWNRVEARAKDEHDRFTRFSQRWAEVLNLPQLFIAV